MNVEDAIRTACRANGRIYAAHVIKDYGYAPETVYAALRKMFRAGILDRRINFVKGYSKPFMYQYWLTEDPEGTE